MSECGCVYSTFDGDGPQWCRVETRTARKPYACTECRQPIAKGERHEHVTGQWDGRIDTSRTCLACVEIRNLLFCDGFNYGALWEDVREYWACGGKTQGCIDKLESATAKQKLADAYRDYLEIPT